MAESYSNTPQGKAQSKRMVDCRIGMGCNTAKDFFEKYSHGRFSYTQYQKYESGERLLSKKAAMLYSSIFNVDWEWLQNGDGEVNSYHNRAPNKQTIKTNTIDEQLLIKIITKVEQWEDDNDYEYEPADKAKLVKLIYLKLQEIPVQEQDKEATNIIDIYDYMKKAN